MPLTSMIPLLEVASREGYAVGQFNFHNIDGLLAILRAAEAKRAPVSLGPRFLPPRAIAARVRELVAETPKPPADMKNLSELRIVLAADNALVAQVTSKQLGRVFGEIELAENGRVALEKILENPPDVLITDLFMPEMAGDELVQRLREENIDIPMIGLTAAVVGDDIQRFEEAGATAVLAKPLDVSRLCLLLEEKVEG